MRVQLKKLIMICMIVGLFCCLGACKEKSQQEKANEAFIDIVLNNGSFIDVKNDGAITKISDYSTDEIDAEINGYIYIDIDDDGTKELGIYLNVNNGTFKILKYKDENVYSYEWTYASARSIGETGVMFDMEMSGATEFYKLLFSDNGVERKVICGTKIEAGEVSYYVGGNTVDIDTYKTYIEECYKSNAKIYNDLDELEDILGQ